MQLTKCELQLAYWTQLAPFIALGGICVLRIEKHMHATAFIQEQTVFITITVILIIPKNLVLQILYHVRSYVAMYVTSYHHYLQCTDTVWVVIFECLTTLNMVYIKLSNSLQIRKPHEIHKNFESHENYQPYGKVLSLKQQ